MLSKETLSKLVNILKTLSSGEQSIEITRNILSDNLDFDPYQIFINLAQKDNEFITPTDLVDYFHTKNIFISYTEAKFLILFYDQNYDGVLSFTEFLPLVQSKNSSQKNITKSPIRKMNQDIDYYLIKLFQKEVDLVKEIIKLLYDIRIKKDFDCHSIYHEIKNVSKITEESIGEFFEKNLTSFINDELIAIMKRLDINKDGIVDLCELHAFFGFPNCTFCCSCTPCPSCGICCCKECISDIPCYIHKCIHHQCHSPLETKTVCNSPLRTKNISSPKRNYESNNIKRNNIYIENEKNDIYEENKYNNNNNLRNRPDNNNYLRNRRDNNSYLRNRPDNNNQNSYILETKNIELKTNDNSKKKYSSPKRYYINSQSDIGSTLYSSSGFNNNTNNFSNPKRSFNNTNFSNFSNSYNTLNNKNKPGYEEGQFKEYLKILMKLENDIEKGKMELSLCNDFTYDNGFNIFDKNYKCHINFEELKMGLISLGLEEKDYNINLLFNRLDPQKCGCISYDNFTCFLSPQDYLSKNKIEQRMKNPMGYNNFLSYETRLYFKNLFKLIISGEKKLNELREDYYKNNCMKNLFGLIDNSGMGCFSENDLKKYLIDNEIYTDGKSCVLLFLRLDKNRDGKVDICEFEEEFMKI